jgi:phage regulator Rha-like protein
MAKKTKSEVMVKHSSLDSPSTHETGKDLALVEVQGEQVVTSSLLVAQKFGKRHDHLLRDIRNLLSNEHVPKIGEMFCKAQMPDAYGRLQNSLALKALRTAGKIRLSPQGSLKQHANVLF